MLTNEDSIPVINHLIEISIDGQDGYLEAAEEIENQELKQYLLRKSDLVKQSVSELQNLVRGLGGEPAESSTIIGNMHRIWIDIKTFITANDTLAVLEELERGEDVALHEFREASQKDLPIEVAHVVSRLLAGAQRNHDEIRDMRNTAKVNKELSK